MINLKSYSKIRVVLAIPMIIFAFVITSKIIEDYSAVQYYVVIPYFIGTILFIFNRKLADYISFAIFTFGFSGIIAFWFSMGVGIKKPEELSFFVIALSVLTFLLVSIFKNNKE